METQGAIISIDKEKERFYNHLSFSDRIIFSAKFGDGKTFFLENFFEQYDKEFYYIKIYPVNYQVEDNKDIFELIKKDILVQLLANDSIADDNTVIDNSLFTQYYLLHNGGDIILDILSSIPQIKAPVEIVQKTLKHLAKFKGNKELAQETTTEKISKYIQNIADTKISCEYDSYSEIITRCITRIRQEENKKIVLVIEDLDRMDPAHIFRILNIVSAHIDRINTLPDKEKCIQQSNKFDFDKIIIVCDYDNIKKIFHHFYGPNTDFNGYINKFSTGKPFHYSLKKNVQEYINDKLSEIFKLPSYKTTPIKFLEEELREKTIRECIYILNKIEAEIKPDYITLEKFKINTINPGTLLFVLLNRLGIDIESLSFYEVIKENSEILTKIIGVNWLLVYKEEKNTLWIPSNDSPHCGQYFGMPIQLHTEGNIVHFLDLPKLYFEQKHIIKGLEQIKNKLTPYIKS